ncbi:hypothetical protein GCM10027445_52860 [Amycolatopsis endophytica]|uniref:Uncharacterized protein n=1 Tax=Amycolatopsis endophytica TaxID=860233 RepID=A0A853BAN8_9PSEU|nr:hypothetical protein [Amycolatopsis endophytica]NYI91767.1 hypothetical protein [Amycolatopsis endophytica]
MRAVAQVEHLVAPQQPSLSRANGEVVVHAPPASHPGNAGFSALPSGPIGEDRPHEVERREAGELPRSGGLSDGGNGLGDEVRDVRDECGARAGG